jgi:patatin-like phospholipase/acyl hydrolase
MGEQFKILSLSGGGYLGLYTISFLEAIEKRFGAPIARYFDLLAGTSVGGIIALGLAAEVPASKIRATFEEGGTSVFSHRPAPTSRLQSAVDLFRYFGKPKYSDVALRKMIGGLVGENGRIGNLKHRLILPAVNLTKGKPQLFKTPPTAISRRTFIDVWWMSRSQLPPPQPTSPSRKLVTSSSSMVVYTQIPRTCWRCTKLNISWARQYPPFMF